MVSDDPISLVVGALFISWGFWLVLVGATTCSRRVVVTHYLWLSGPLIFPVIGMVVAAALSIGEFNSRTVLLGFFVAQMLLYFLSLEMMTGSIIVLNASFKQFTEAFDSVLKDRGLDWDVDDDGNFVLQPSGVTICFSDKYYVSPYTTTMDPDEHGVGFKHAWGHSDLVKGILRDFRSRIRRQEGTHRWKWSFVMMGFGLFIGIMGWMIIMYI